MHGYLGMGIKRVEPLSILGGHLAVDGVDKDYDAIRPVNQLCGTRLSPVILRSWGTPNSKTEERGKHVVWARCHLRDRVTLVARASVGSLQIRTTGIMSDSMVATRFPSRAAMSIAADGRR